MQTAVEAFKLTNASKQKHIDFIYAALLKMKEYNAHNHLEAYRKIMEIFPKGSSRFLMNLILKKIKKRNEKLDHQNKTSCEK